MAAPPARFVPAAPSVDAVRTPGSGGVADPVASVEDAATGAHAEGVALRGRAVTAAMTAYTAAHGHPIEHESDDDDRPERRWATPTRVATAAVLVLVLLCTAVVVHALRRAPDAVAELTAPLPLVQGQQPTPGGDAPSVGGADRRTSADEGGTDDAETAGEGPVRSPDVIVHVVGQVVAPGVVTLPSGSRVVDAVEAAGGSTPEADLAALNLARLLQDGEQVAVPRPGEALPAAAGAPPPPGTAPAGASATGVLDLNTADASALDALPGIGPVLAARIVEWRSANDGFTTVEELREVSGIGSTVLESLRDLVRV